MIRLTDNTTNRTYVLEDRRDLGDKLDEIFDATQDGVAEAIDRIRRFLGHEHTGDAEAFLNISVENED